MGLKRLFILFLCHFLCYCAIKAQQKQDTLRSDSARDQKQNSIIKKPDTTNNFLKSGSSNEIKDPATATWLSVALPGAGQFYNETYWKIPIIYGFGGYFVFKTAQWHHLYKDVFLKGYQLLAKNDTAGYLKHSSKHEELRRNYSVNNLQRLRDNSHRNRDMFIILSSVVYILNILDANVDAHLSEFDMSDSISMKIDPVLDFRKSNMVNGLSLTLNFKK